MGWTAATWWWLAAGGLVAAELATGTFYLLMLALGAAAAALAAHAGAGVAAQWVVGALIGAGATAAWHWRRARAPRSAPTEHNRDVNIDIGQPVQVDAWGADGSARVAYRGSSWLVRHEGTGSPQPGPHVIVSVQAGHLGVASAGGAGR
jgi:membrane protein implicated in regulation of membrane protease activity